jgi:hypothetical protein
LDKSADFLSMRTDDVAQRIEYATSSSWSPAQYKSVCAILRMYRHQSILQILDRAAGGSDETGRDAS